MTENHKIGKKIKFIREKKKLSQSAVVDKLADLGIYMSRETLSKIETNSRIISAVELNAISRVLDVDIGQFFLGKKPEDDLVTFFRRKNFSHEALKEISDLQDIVKTFIEQEKIYKKNKEEVQGYRK